MDNKELAQQMINAVKGFVARSMAPFESLNTRLTTVECRTGALAMLFGKNGSAEKIAEVEALLQRVKSLENRLKSFEERSPLAYGGTRVEGQRCQRGTFYTHAGSIWYCNVNTDSRPGENSDFTLACKRGADGKSAH